MSGHPCRAHHKLKWARKGQSGLEVLYELIPRSEISNAISAENSVVYSASPLSGEPFVYGAALLRLSPHRFLSMELAHTEARSPKTTIRAHFNLWWARTMKRCSYNLIASGRYLPALNSDLWLSAGSAPTFP